MFKRLNKISLIQKYKHIFSSRAVVKRMGQYYIFRIARISASAHSIALGFAIGVAVSFSPLVGMHFLTTIFFCFILRGSIVAGMMGSLVGNPWTWPVIWTLSYKLSVIFGVGGHAMDAHDIHHLGKDFSHAIKHLKFKALWYDIWPVFYKILMGTIPLGIACGVAFYFLIKGIINRIRTNRTTSKHLKREQSLAKDKAVLKEDLNFHIKKNEDKNDAESDSNSDNNNH